jgi:hypothetical protein
MASGGIAGNGPRGVSFTVRSGRSRLLQIHIGLSFGSLAEFWHGASVAGAIASGIQCSCYGPLTQAVGGISMAVRKFFWWLLVGHMVITLVAIGFEVLLMVTWDIGFFYGNQRAFQAMSEEEKTHIFGEAGSLITQAAVPLLVTNVVWLILAMLLLIVNRFSRVSLAQSP